jgi:HTH-type transcriptional regulator/antitoxin HipB
MVDAFPVRFPDQLRQHLRALRKRQGLTQTQLGALVGVSQARIAEIEANPGLVNFEQLMKLLSVLGVSLTLQPGTVAPAAAGGASQPKARIATKAVKPQPRSAPAARRSFVARPKKGSW